MADGDRNRVSIVVASIPAVLAMKGYAVANRLKRKYAYDIYYSVRKFPDGTGALVKATRPLLNVELALQGYRLMSDKFRDAEDFGLSSVRRQEYLLRAPTFLAIARQTSGGRMRSGRSTPG